MPEFSVSTSPTRIFLAQPSVLLLFVLVTRRSRSFFLVSHQPRRVVGFLLAVLEGSATRRMVLMIFGGLPERTNETLTLSRFSRGGGRGGLPRCHRVQSTTTTFYRSFHWEGSGEFLSPYFSNPWNSVCLTFFPFQSLAPSAQAFKRSYNPTRNVPTLFTSQRPPPLQGWSTILATQWEREKRNEGRLRVSETKAKPYTKDGWQNGGISFACNVTENHP